MKTSRKLGAAPLALLCLLALTAASAFADGSTDRASDAARNPGAKASRSEPVTVRATVTLFTKLSDGRYRVEGITSPVVKGTVVRITARRNNKVRKYSVKTKKSGTFGKTIRVPSGTGRLQVSVTT
ncbi:MAG: hypothetical protein JHC98_09010 [Thermoleophilaceae bacterium]|nr:hypothetical protein [Thermoleophilaceae bacterium]